MATSASQVYAYMQYKKSKDTIHLFIECMDNKDIKHSVCILYICIFFIIILIPILEYPPYYRVYCI